MTVWRSNASPRVNYIESLIDTNFEITTCRDVDFSFVYAAEGREVIDVIVD